MNTTSSAEQNDGVNDPINHTIIEFIFMEEIIRNVSECVIISVAIRPHVKL